MRKAVAYGQKQAEFELAERDVIPVRRQAQPEALHDPAAAVRTSLEAPFQFPALRKALTPDDHIVVVLDEHLPQLAALLIPLLEHLAAAGIQPEAITLVCPIPMPAQPWLEELPEEFENIRIEIHDPANRDHLSYLATTQKGRRVYLNRSTIDADQVVVLSRRNYDPLTGYAGAETTLFPALAEEATLREAQKHLSLKVPGRAPWLLQREATEVTWLLGVPFFVQVIEGPGSGVAQVLSGTLESSVEGQRLLDAAWRVEVPGRADVVVAGVSGDPARHGLEQMARALAAASRVVKPEGRIVLLTDSAPILGPAAQVLREAGDGQQALRRVSQEDCPDRATVFQWASAASQATIYLLSRLPTEQAEDLLTIPLGDPGQAQRLLTPGRSCVFLPDADKMMAVLHEERV